MSYAKGDTVQIHFQGTWSAVIDEVITVPESALYNIPRYLIRINGLVVPTGVQKPVAFPLGHEFVWLNHADLTPTYLAGKSNKSPVKQEEIPPLVGRTVTWTDGDQKFAGVVKTINVAHHPGCCLIYTGDYEEPTKIVSLVRLDLS